MYDYTYEEAINKLKEVYPQFKDVRFTLEDGLLGWSYDSRFDVNIHELQKFINEFLGQKVYRAEYVAHRDVYARSEEEAREFARGIEPNPALLKVNLTNLNKTEMY